MNKILISIIIFLVLIGSFGGYYYFYKKPQISQISENKISENINQVKLEKMPDLGLFKQGVETYNSSVSSRDNKPQKLIVKTYYEYYKYGQVPSGKYQGYSIYIVKYNRSAWEFQSGQSTNRKNSDEVYFYDFIAVKGNDYVSREKTFDPENDKGVFLGTDEFPLIIPFEESYKVNNTYKLLKSFEFGLMEDWRNDSRAKLTKLNLTVNGYNTYFIEYDTTLDSDFRKDDFKTYVKFYIVDFNGVGVSYDSRFLYPLSDLNLKGVKYKKYQDLIASCSSEAFEIDQKMISSATLEKIQNDKNIEIFRIKNFSDNTFDDLRSMVVGSFGDNNQLDVPSEKLAKNLDSDTVLIYQDAFGVYRGLVQADTLVARGGCGKPVIYLYPEKTTQVSFRFINPINFTTVIPNYENSWEVNANPNGTLNDLKQEITNCNSFGNKIGSEYAKNACVKNEYPYLYWSGNTNNIFYPKSNVGFIVSKKDLNSFFEKKLLQMNFTQKEISDFKEYWVTYLSKKNSDYFRISFFQNDLVNNMFPVNINPKPTSTIRMFMDWDYASKDSIIREQKLISYPRSGFTMVEWGGLKK